MGYPLERVTRNQNRPGREKLNTRPQADQPDYRFPGLDTDLHETWTGYRGIGQDRGPRIQRDRSGYRTHDTERLGQDRGPMIQRG